MTIFFVHNFPEIFFFVKIKFFQLILPFDVLWSNQDPGGSTESDPRVSRNHFGGKTLTGILDEELGDEVFGLIGDVLPLGLRKVEMTILDGVKE